MVLYNLEAELLLSGVSGLGAVRSRSPDMVRGELLRLTGLVYLNREFLFRLGNSLDVSPFGLAPGSVGFRER